MADVEESKSWQTAMMGYDQALRAIVDRFRAPDILELGGGRHPSFRMSELPECVASYTVNDISRDELALVPPGYSTACFDVSGDVAGFEGSYDVVFSRFLAEHVPDGRAMHRNVHALLRPGGVAFHLIPTLYALPFVINRALPEEAGGKLLSLFVPRRNISPKFPAHYSACYGDTSRMRNMFNDIGYSKADIRNFYGHFYYEGIPGLRSIEKRFTALASRMNWSWCSSYAYLVVEK